MPRIAVISDIHGNCTALDAVLTDAQQQVVNQFICLDDSLPGGAQPALTVQRLRELSCPIVMGNADASLVSVQEPSMQFSHWTTGLQPSNFAASRMMLPT